MNFNQILLFALAEPEYSRIEFWDARQKESEFSPMVFWKKLNDSWQSYYDKISSKIELQNSLGGNLTNYAIPLLFETNQQMTGHLGLDELSLLYSELYKYAESKSLLKYYYYYDFSNIHVSLKSSPAKNYEIFKVLKQQRFTKELEKKQPNEIAEFLNFHFRYYKRYGGEIKDWVNNTQKLAPSTFNTYQLDAFYSWFENIEIPGFPQTDFNSNQDAKQKFIAEKLEGLRDKFNSDKDFNKAIELIDRFFKGQKINIKTPIFIKSGTIKKLAFCLGEIWRGERNEVITYEYLKFYQQVFSVFKDQEIDPDNLFGCSLYKYSISKT